MICTGATSVTATVYRTSPYLALRKTTSCEPSGTWRLGQRCLPDRLAVDKDFGGLVGVEVHHPARQFERHGHDLPGHGVDELPDLQSDRLVDEVEVSPAGRDHHRGAAGRPDQPSALVDGQFERRRHLDPRHRGHRQLRHASGLDDDVLLLLAERGLDEQRVRSRREVGHLHRGVAAGHAVHGDLRPWTGRW